MDYKDKLGLIPVRVQNSTGFLELESNNQAFRVLDIPLTTLKRYMNFKNFFVYSPTLDESVYIFPLI